MGVWYMMGSDKGIGPKRPRTSWREITILNIAVVLILQALGIIVCGPIDGEGPMTSSDGPGSSASSAGLTTTAGSHWEETDWSNNSQYALASSVDTNSSIGDIHLEVESGSTTVDIYVADFGNNRIVRTGMDGSGWSTFGSAGTGVGQFESTSALTFDNGTGRLYICDDTNHRIVMTRMDGSDWTTLGSAGTGEDQFHNPRGIDLDPVTDDLYIADLHNARIVRTGIDGSGWISNDVDFEVPKGMKYDASSGLVYITDLDVVIRMRMDGTEREVFDPVELGVGQVGRLTGIDLDPETGFIYMTDNSLDHIVRTRFDGSGWTIFGASGDGVGQFNRPEGLRFDPDTGYVFVADTENNRVVRTRMDGSGWAALGSLGDGEGEFDYPLDVEVDRSFQPYFAAQGTLVSSPHDSRGQAVFDGIEWNATLLPGTHVTFQVRTAPTREGLAGEAFVGPDGSPSSRYIDPGAMIWSGHEGDRWMQYRTVLTTSDPSRTPTLHNVSIGYNTPPKILAAGVLPEEGNITTMFNFTLRFDDTDGDQPVVALVTIDGVDHTLSRHFVQDPHFPGTTMWYESKLTAGEHRYNLSVSDGELWCHTEELVLNVDHGPVHSIKITPGEASVTTDDVLQFEASAYDEAGHVLPIQVEWSVSGGGAIDGTGRFEPAKVGTWKVFANASGVSSEALVEVVVGALASITVIPDEAVLTTDDELTFDSVGHDLDGNEVPIMPTWGVLGGGTIDWSGHFEATIVGEWYILAQVGDVVGEAAVLIDHGALDRMIITPGSSVVTADEQLRFTASGYDGDGNPVPVSTTWSVNGGGTITQDGIFDAEHVGEWQVEVQASGLYGTSAIVVEPGELFSMQVFPEGLEINVSETFRFTARGFDADGNEVVPSPQWSVNGGGHVTGAGEFTANEEGTWAVQAAQEEVSSAATITVLAVESQEDPADTEPISTGHLLILIAIAASLVLAILVLRSEWWADH